MAFVYCGPELIVQLTENFQQLCAFSGGFCSLVIMNSTAMNIHVQTFMLTYVFLVIFLGMELLGVMITLCLNFLKNCSRFLNWLHYFKFLLPI